MIAFRKQRMKEKGEKSGHGLGTRIQPTGSHPQSPHPSDQAPPPSSLFSYEIIAGLVR